MNKNGFLWQQVKRLKTEKEELEKEITELKIENLFIKGEFESLFKEFKAFREKNLGLNHNNTLEMLDMKDEINAKNIQLERDLTIIKSLVD